MRADLSAVFGERTALLLARIGVAAKEFGIESYLVGGAVRDLILARSSDDLDVMVVGEAKPFLTFLKKNWDRFLGEFPHPGEPTYFPRYFTAKLAFDQEIVPGVVGLDFASARGERYPISAGNPEVFLADLSTDLGRRDFGVNAIALSLNSASVAEGAMAEFGELIDPHSGVTDIGRSELNILHPESFVDDPARIVRGVRLIARLGFRFGSKTEKHFAKAQKQRGISQLPRHRAFDELRKALAERDPKPVILALRDYGVLAELGFKDAVSKAIERQLPGDASAIISLRDGLKTKSEIWELVLVLLWKKVAREEFQQWLVAMDLPAKRRSSLLSLHSLVRSQGV